VRHSPTRPVENQPPQTYTDSGAPVSSYRSPAYQPIQVQRNGYVWPQQPSAGGT
jgi:hypothetical protein